MNILINKTGKTHFLGKEISYTIGKNGITNNKREGDKKTPVGILKPVEIFYRAGRITPPKLKYWPIRPLYPNDGWCDESKDMRYNHFIRHPYRASAEKLIRQDCLYDLVVVTDYNYPDAISDKGSAVFIHLKHPKETPTLGCIGFNLHDLKRILLAMRPHEGFIIS